MKTGRLGIHAVTGTLHVRKRSLLSYCVFNISYVFTNVWRRFMCKNLWQLTTQQDEVLELLKSIYFKIWQIWSCRRVLMTDYCHRCILLWISPRTARSSQRKASRKVNVLGAASRRQCTSAHIPCCHCRCV